MPITFNNLREVTEYIEQKFLEGYECEAKKIGKDKWKVWVISKRERTSPKLMATEILEKALTANYEGNLRETYQQISDLYKPVRSANDIKRIVGEELSKANLHNVEIYITPEHSSVLQADASVNEPEKEGEPWQIGIHPIHKYTNEDYLRETVRHEIKHIKAEIE